MRKRPGPSIGYSWQRTSERALLHCSALNRPELYSKSLWKRTLVCSRKRQKTEKTERRSAWFRTRFSLDNHLVPFEASRHPTYYTTERNRASRWRTDTYSIG
jgi:hypothetical protein